MNRKVAFTAMDHGSREDYDLVEAHDARDRYRGHQHYEACVEFCARWDQVSSSVASSVATSVPSS